VSALIRVYRDDETPLYIQIADAVRGRVADGQLRAGDKLPSVRVLSDELGVNPATVVSAYRILMNEKLLEARAGSGAYVSPSAISVDHSGPALAGIKEQTKSAMSVDLASNMPPRDLYPLEEVKRFLVEAVDIDGGGAFDYQDAAGYGPLRTTIASRLGMHGVDEVDPDDVHIVSGAQQGLDLVARILLRRGDVAAMENPGYRGAREAFLAAGARVEAVTLRGDGLDLDALERLAGSVPLRLVYINPDFQNPTSAVYPPESRARLVGMASRHGFYILEDSQVSDLAYDGVVPEPAKSFDRDGRVLFVKSFSKSVMPGLRIAFLQAPAVFQPRLEAAKRAIDLSANGLMQRVLERYLSSGAYDMHLPVVRARYHASALAYTALLEKYRGTGLSWIEPAGGLNLWLELPPAVDPDMLAHRLAARGYLMAPGSGFYHQGSGEQRSIGSAAASNGHVRVSFGHADPEHLAGSVSAMIETLDEFRRNA
jgi:DNA-binding transcriptional MocR family regulator